MKNAEMEVTGHTWKLGVTCSYIKRKESKGRTYIIVLRNTRENRAKPHCTVKDALKQSKDTMEIMRNQMDKEHARRTSASCNARKHLQVSKLGD